MEPIFTRSAENSCFVCFFVTDFDGIVISGSEGKRIFGNRVVCAIKNVILYLHLRKKRSRYDEAKDHLFDIDGTLVPLKEGIRPRTVEALQKLRQNGIRLCIATGRTPMEMPKFEGVTFDALLTYNGSYCFTPERDIFKNLIPKEDIVTLRRNAAALGRPLALATDSRLVANGTEPDLEEYFAIGLGEAGRGPTTLTRWRRAKSFRC